VKPSAGAGCAAWFAGCRRVARGPSRIEPYWVHGKRAVVEPGRKLTATELIVRVCDYYGCEQYSHLSK